MAENGGPDRGWRLIEDPEFGVRVKEDGDVFFGCWSDLEAAAVELDAVVVGDPARAAQREVKVEQGWRRAGAESRAALALAEAQDVGGDLLGGAVDGGVLAVDFHGQDAIGLVVGSGFGVSEQGDQTALEGSEAAFDLALGLRGCGHQVGHVERAQGTLELAARVASVVIGAWTEKAQGVGVDGLWQPEALEGRTEVAEVGPGGVAGHEASGDIEAGVVVDRE